MQLYALDSKGSLISARSAHRQADYHCLECRQVVRLRGGPHRQRHFYHADPTPFCRQSQKGEVHLQLQLFFLRQLPAGDCHLEYRFPEINRIADVAWASERVVFEIQCSPISAEEVDERNRDYHNAGWQVVWILHDNRYNQQRLSAAELLLRSTPHYFSNMDKEGSGMIYDQFDITHRGLRLARLPPLPIDILKKTGVANPKNLPYPLRVLRDRRASWPFSFSGDLTSRSVDSAHASYFNQALAIEKLYLPSDAFTGKRSYIRRMKHGVARFYRVFFRFMLERMCR